MTTSKSLFYWFSLFVICFISFQQISDNFRPSYNGSNLIVIYLLGIAPNFFPAIGIPSLFVVIIPQLKRNNKWLKENKHLTANLISLKRLISWEFIQTNSKKLHFDWNDILWTFIGAFVFQLVWTITPEKYKEIK